MAETLYLRLPANDSPASWLLVDVLGNRIGRVQQGTLTDAAAQAHGRRLCVIVPGARISLFHVDIPTRNQQKVLQAVPFALEDRLAEDVELMHFALGARDEQGYRVAALKRTDITHWLEQLASADLEPDQLVPDMLALPVQNETLTAALDRGHILARFPDGSGFSAEESLAPLLAERFLAQVRATMTCDKAVIHAADPEAAASLMSAFGALELDVQTASLNDDSLLPLFAATLHQKPAINLLQGEFGRRKGMSEHWQRWRVAIVLLAVFCVAGIVQQGVAYFELRHQAAQLDAQVLEEFHKALPDVHRVVDPRAQMQQRLSQLSGGNDSNGPLAMLMSLGTALQANSTVQLTGFSYHSGTLQVQVQADQIQALDNLKNALQEDGHFNVNLDSVNSNSGQASGRLTLTGNSP